MRKVIPAVVFLAVAIPLSQAAQKDDEAKKLNGTYEVIEVLVGGKSDDSKKDAKIRFVFKDGTITIMEGGGKEETAKFTVDASKKPAQIDILPDRGDKKTVPGIYELKEVDKTTNLTIAFSKGGGERPKDLKGTGPGEVVLKLRKK